MMEDLFKPEQFNQDIYQMKGSIGEQARNFLQQAMLCVNQGSIQSSDCRLAISKLITAEGEGMLPRIVQNLEKCLRTRNYPADYQVDYFFPPVGCAKEACTIFIARQVYWKRHQIQEQPRQLKSIGDDQQKT